MAPGSDACHHKCQACETSADEKERSLFKCWHLRKVSRLASSKPHLNFSVQAEVFLRREKESRIKRLGGGTMDMPYFPGVERRGRMGKRNRAGLWEFVQLHPIFLLLLMLCSNRFMADTCGSSWVTGAALRPSMG